MSHYDEFQPYDKPSIDERKIEPLQNNSSQLDFDDDNYLQFCTNKQKEAFLACRNSKTITSAAKSLGATRSGVRSHLRNIKAKAISGGYVKSTSSLYLVPKAEIKPCDDFNINAKLDSLAGDYHEYVKQKRFNMIVTSAQNSTPVHLTFLSNLKRLESKISAKILVIPFRYKNPTPVFVNDSKDYWDESLTPYLCEDDFELCSNLAVLGQLKSQPTAVRPLSGLEQVTGDKSAIIGHTKLELKSVATPSNKMAKLLISTGCCTVANYTDSKAGYKGGKRHSLSAIIVEVDGDMFFQRQVVADEDGNFIDMLTEYKNGKSMPAPQAQVLSTGDLHAINADEQAISATFFANDSMLKYFRPEWMTVDDSLDFQSGSHHSRNDPIIQYHLMKNGLNSVENELKITFKMLDDMETDHTKIVIKRSNHDEHFEKWVKETDPRRDPLNCRTWCEAFTAMLDGHDPYEYFAENMMKTFDDVRFLSRDEVFVVGGVAHDGHGDKGANGSRGGLQSFIKLGCPAQWGHSHTAGIMDDQFQNGTNSKIRMGYNVGPSSWMHCNTIQYANGKRSLLFIINGKWRFDTI